jgi:hypothetical protein
MKPKIDTEELLCLLSKIDPNRVVVDYDALYPALKLSNALIQAASSISILVGQPPFDLGNSLQWLGPSNTRITLAWEAGTGRMIRLEIWGGYMADRILAMSLQGVAAALKLEFDATPEE